MNISLKNRLMIEYTLHASIIAGAIYSTFDDRDTRRMAIQCGLYSLIGKVGCDITRVCKHTYNNWYKERNESTTRKRIVSELKNYKNTDAYRRILQCYDNKEKTLLLGELNLTNDFPLHVLEMLPQLKTVDLHGNQFEYIDDRIGTLSLTSLNLSENPLGRLPSAISKLSSLQTLDVSNTGIESLDKISSLANLQILDARDNKIGEITDHTLNGLKALYEAKLTGNPLQSLPDFRKNPELKILRLPPNGTIIKTGDKTSVKIAYVQVGGQTEITS